MTKTSNRLSLLLGARYRACETRWTRRLRFRVRLPKVRKGPGEGRVVHLDYEHHTIESEQIKSDWDTGRRDRAKTH